MSKQDAGTDRCEAIARLYLHGRVRAGDIELLVPSLGRIISQVYDVAYVAGLRAAAKNTLEVAAHVEAVVAASSDTDPEAKA